MNRVVTYQEFLNLDFRNLWELKNPKFATVPDGSHDALPQFKLRHSGSSLGHFSNILTPSRLYGLRKIFAGLLWLFIVVLIFGTALAYRTGSGELGQIYFTLLFVAAYLLLFIDAGKSRLRRWDRIYTKAVKADLVAHTKPVIIFDGQDLLLANARLFERIGQRPIAAFVDEFQSQFKRQEKDAIDAKKIAAKEKARLKKEKEDKEFQDALAEVGPLIGSGLKNLVREGGLSSRAAQSARGTLKTDSLSSRAAKAARGAPPTEKEPRDRPASGASDINIEGYTGSTWETCATGLDNNANYIANRMKQIRKSNPRYTKLRAVDGQGRVVDVG